MLDKERVVKVAIAVALLPVLAACATTSAASQERAVPANYKLLIAKHIRATEKNPILSAQVSRPSQAWMGLINGGNRPIACARWTFKGSLIDQTQVAGYFFENGKISEAFYPSYYGGAMLLTCGNVTYVPFPELRSK